MSKGNRVILDKRLSFEPHITNTINRICATISMLYPLINRRSKLSINNKLILYKSIFRPIFNICLRVLDFILDSRCKRLQVMQNKLLKLTLTDITRSLSCIEKLHHRNISEVSHVDRSAIGDDDRLDRHTRSS